MKEQFEKFLNGFNFDGLMGLLDTGKWQGIDLMVIVVSTPVIVVAVVLVIALISRKTRVQATLVVQWGAVAVVYFVCGVALRNSAINEIGPFLLATMLVGGAIAYFAYNNLIKGG